MIYKNSTYLLGFLFAFILSTSFPFSYGDIGTVSVDSFGVDYNIENGILDTIFLDPDFVELILTMDTFSDGLLKLQFQDHYWMQNLTH